VRIQAQRPGPSARAGFTLAEVAVTLLIVSIGLVLVLQGLSTAKVSAAETHYRKVARELALLTLGRVEAGLFWEELDGDGSTLTGSYAEEGYEAFHYELVFGEEDFSQRSEGPDRNSSYHDSWEYERERERERREREHESSKDEDEQTKEPFEKVRIRVEYPRITERESTLTLERWIPWEQVYGGEDGEAPAAPAEEDPE
jgi:prepilin-type N-terminal cleavage/methylation domain-containing protein